MAKNYRRAALILLSVSVLAIASLGIVTILKSKDKQIQVLLHRPVPVETPTSGISRGSIEYHKDLVIVNNDHIKLSAILPYDWKITDNSGDEVMNKNIEIEKNGYKITISLVFGGGGYCIYPDNPRYYKPSNPNFIYEGKIAKFTEVRNYSGWIFRINEPDSVNSKNTDSVIIKSVCQGDTNNQMVFSSSQMNLSYPSAADKVILSELKEILRTLVYVL